MTQKPISEIVEEFNREQIALIGVAYGSLNDWLTTTLEARDKAVREEIIDDYGFFNDGCGCCSDADLCKELTGESFYDRQDRTRAASTPNDTTN